MRKKQSISVLLLILALTFIMDGSIFAQRHMNRKEQMTRYYDPSTVETLTGEIVKIDRREKLAWNNSQTGIHITIKTVKESIVAHLGPAWFINNHITLTKGDMVDIEGSRITYSLKSIIIVKKIKNGDKVLILRDDKGIPVWSGQGVRAKNF